MKVTKSQMRQVFPKAVQDYVFGLVSQYRTRNVTLHHESPGWQLYLAEGAKYKMFMDGAEFKVLRMQSQDSLHAGGPKASHKIGERVPIPQGAWLVEFELFLGKPFIHVYHVGLEAIECT